VIGACDVDPDGSILTHLPYNTLISGFQIPREFDDPITPHSLADALTRDAWRDIEKLVVRRGGTINYRLVSPGIYQATCLIALGKIRDVGELTACQGGTSQFSASL